jgi:hypothetical protein
MNKDPVIADLDEYLRKQEDDYVDIDERKREMAEREADEAMATWEGG